MGIELQGAMIFMTLFSKLLSQLLESKSNNSQAETFNIL